MKQIEVQGLTIQFDTTALLDLDAVTWLGEIDDGKPFHLKPLMEMLFGSDMPRIMEHLRKEGRVHIVDAANFMAQAIEAAGQGE